MLHFWALTEGEDDMPLGEQLARRVPWTRIRASGTRLTTPLHPDDYLSMVNPLWSARELRGRIEEVVRETDDAATVVIRPGWGWRWDHRPGQYVGIGLQVGGKFHWRSYSISSPPVRSGRTLAITVRAMPEGFLSDHLVNGCEPGTIVRLAAPEGDFVLPDPPSRADPVPRRRQRHHAGDGDAAHPGPSRHDARRRPRTTPRRRPERMIFRDELAGPGRAPRRA